MLGSGPDVSYLIVVSVDALRSNEFEKKLLSADLRFGDGAWYRRTGFSVIRRTEKL